MAEITPHTQPSNASDDARPPATRSKTWFSSPLLKDSFRKPTRSATGLAGEIKPTAPERSNSWANFVRRTTSTNSLKAKTAGVDGAYPKPRPKLFKRFLVEEMSPLADEIVYTPDTIFSGRVITNASTPYPKVRIAVTFQAVAQAANGFSATFVNVTQTVSRGELQSGMRVVLFAFRFPHVNLPPTSQVPRIKYFFRAALEIGDDLQQRYSSNDLEIRYLPIIDSTLPALISEARNGQEGAKHSITFSKSGGDKVAAAISANPRVAVEVFTDPETGRAIAGLRVKLANPTLLPGDQFTVDFEVYVPQGKSEPTSMIIALEEIKKLVIEGNDKDSIFRSSPESVRKLIDKVIPLDWASTVNATKQINGFGKKYPGQAKAIDGSHSMDAIRLGKVLLQSFTRDIPGSESFQAGEILPTFSLPLNGRFPDPENGSVEIKGLAEKPLSTVLGGEIPDDRANRGIGMRMIVEHRLRISIPLTLPRIITKRPTLVLVMPIIIGNINVEQSQRQANIEAAAAAKQSRLRRASIATNPSFLLTTAPDDDEITTSSSSGGGLSRRTSSSADKGKTPMYRLKTEESEQTANSITHDLPGSPVVIELDIPHEDAAEEAKAAAEANKAALRTCKTAADTQERPYFWKTQWEEPYPE